MAETLNTLGAKVDALCSRHEELAARMENHHAELFEQLREVKSSQARMDERLDSTGRTVRNLDVTIRGNGTAGLTERIRSIERWQSSVQRLVWIGVIGVVGLFGNLLWEILRWYIAQKG